MRTMLAGALIITAASVAGCGAGEPEPDWQPTLPLTTPPIAYTALAQESPGARLYEVVGVRWPDSCIGIYEAQFVCRTVDTPGYLILIEKNGWLIEYHSDRGDVLRRAGFAGRVKDRQ